MPNTNFLIVKTCECGELEYWNLDHGWMHGVCEDATIFPDDIRWEPLPIGAECVIEVTEDGEPVSQTHPLSIYPLPYRGC